jgi:hypothetical protein
MTVLIGFYLFGVVCLVTGFAAGGLRLERTNGDPASWWARTAYVALWPVAVLLGTFGPLEDE